LIRIISKYQIRSQCDPWKEKKGCFGEHQRKNKLFFGKNSSKNAEHKLTLGIKHISLLNYLGLGKKDSLGWFPRSGTLYPRSKALWRVWKNKIRHVRSFLRGWAKNISSIYKKEKNVFYAL
jgi:hypothetical protein